MFKLKVKEEIIKKAFYFISASKIQILFELTQPSE
jgi:hypothetical protein